MKAMEIMPPLHITLLQRFGKIRMYTILPWRIHDFEKDQLVAVSSSFVYWLSLGIEWAHLRILYVKADDTNFNRTTTCERFCISSAKTFFL